MRPGARPLLAGTALLLLVAAGTVPLAAEMLGRYGHAHVRLRGWIVTYDLVVGGLFLGSLLPMLAGAVRARWLPRAPRQVAAGALLLACLSLAGGLAFPFTAGTGPYAHDAAALQVLRWLLLAPPVLVDAALVALLLGLGRAPLHRVGAALAAVDLAQAAWLAHQTSLAVVVRVHPAAHAPLRMVPWLLAGVALLVALRHSRR